MSKREIEVASLFPWLFLAGACSGARACVVVAGGKGMVLLKGHIQGSCDRIQRGFG